MDKIKKKPKILKNLHLAIYNEIKRRPEIVNEDFFYDFMKNTPYHLKETPKKEKKKCAPPPLSKHSREQKVFARSSSPSRRKSLKITMSPHKKYDLAKFSPKAILETENSYDRLIQTPFSDAYYQNSLVSIIKPTEKTKNSDYRKQYDQIFRGRIAKNYLN